MHPPRIASVLLLLVSPSFTTMAQPHSNSPSGQATTLYDEVWQADSTAFAALNAHNVSQLMSFFTPDVEFYNDGGGLTTYEQTSLNFAAMFKGAPDIRRELIQGSLAVYSLKGYGAIATGVHRFCHHEQGREECGSFKFTTIWQQRQGAWKMSRVVSYGH